MNEQRRDFFKNSALGLATITLGAGLSLIPSAQAEEKASNTATTAVENLPEIEAELTLAPNVPKPIERNYPAKVVVKLTALEQIMDLMDGVQFKFWTLMVACLRRLFVCVKAIWWKCNFPTQRVQ